MAAPLYECDCCEALEERVFIDTWTRRSFCLQCLIDLPLETITHSPYTEGDNLPKILEDFP